MMLPKGSESRVLTVREPLGRIDTIQLQVAKARLVVNGPQERALEVLGYLSERLILRGLSESPCDGSTRLIVEVDGSLIVDVDIDGGVGRGACRSRKDADAR